MVVIVTLRCVLLRTFSDVNTETRKVSCRQFLNIVSSKTVQYKYPASALRLNVLACFDSRPVLRVTIQSEWHSVEPGALKKKIISKHSELITANGHKVFIHLTVKGGHALHDFTPLGLSSSSGKYVSKNG